MGSYVLRSYVVEAEEFQPEIRLPDDVRWLPLSKCYVVGCKPWCPRPGDFIIRRQDGTVGVSRAAVFAQQYVEVVGNAKEAQDDGRYEED